MILLSQLLVLSAHAHVTAVEHDHDDVSGELLWDDTAEGSLELALQDLLDQPLDGPVANPIINGVPATEEEYPQAGAMILDADLDLGSYGSGTIRSFVCSSTLIAPDVVMLAAHCVDEYAYTMGYGTMVINEIRWSRQADLTAIDGSSRRKADWPEDAIVVTDYVAHEDFSLRTMDIGIAENYDVALLFLSEPVLDTPYAYVPTEDEGDQLQEGAAAIIVGWGQQEPSESSWEAPESGTYAIKYMGDSVLGEVGEFEFQVGPAEDDPRKCHGDSGGPTFVNVETSSTETLRVVGITSHAYDYTDCDSKGGVDTRVMAVRDWIEARMTEACEDGTRVWCETPGLPLPPEPEPEPELTEGDGDALDGGEDEEKRACACANASAGSTAPWVAGLLGLGLLRRRARMGTARA